MLLEQEFKNGNINNLSLASKILVKCVARQPITFHLDGSDVIFNGCTLALSAGEGLGKGRCLDRL